MAVELQPFINGREYGWADIQCVIASVPVIGITAIKYETEKEKENVYGAGSNVISRGYGRNKATASITLLSGTVMALQSSARDGKLENIAPFPITVCYQPDAGPLVTHVLKMCEFKKTTFDWKEGDMSKDIEFELIIAEVKNKSI